MLFSVNSYLSIYNHPCKVCLILGRSLLTDAYLNGEDEVVYNGYSLDTLRRKMINFDDSLLMMELIVIDKIMALFLDSILDPCLIHFQRDHCKRFWNVEKIN